MNVNVLQLWDFLTSDNEDNEVSFDLDISFDIDLDNEVSFWLDFGVFFNSEQEKEMK